MTTLRVATIDDLPGVVDLWNRAGGPTHLPSRTDEATRLFRRDPEALIIAVERDEIVGTLIVGWDGWRCHLYRLAVAPAFRRRGIARALVEAARTRAVTVGAARLDAVVRLDNPVGVALWEAAGFVYDADDGRFCLLL